MAHAPVTTARITADEFIRRPTAQERSEVVRPGQRLIGLGKTKSEMAVCPVGDHALVRPSSRADEYRRILERFDEHRPVRGGATVAGSR